MSQPSSRNNSMSSVDFQRQLRIDKIQQIKDSGFSPFEIKSKRDYTLYEALNLFTQSKSVTFGEGGTVVTLAGRVKSKRVSGKIAFATVEDESFPNGFQFIFRRDFLTDDNAAAENSNIDEQTVNNIIPSGFDDDGNIVKSMNFEHFKLIIDEGDYIQVTGYLDKSQRGEPSLFVTSFAILTKALRPLPQELDYEHIETRYLDRTADFKMNTLDDNGRSVRDIVRAKAKYWQIWREEMIQEGFLEVECPIFESTPGGADAKPFTTFYNELDQEMYLRISLELPLKKLIAGGFEKVFEIGRIFRNEGSDPTHLQEYTQIEWYWSYSDYYTAIPFTVRIYRRIAEELLGTLEQIDYKGNHINWGSWCSETDAEKQGWKYYNGWPAIAYYDAVRYFSKNYFSGGEIDLEGKSYAELLGIAKKYSIEIETGISHANAIDKIYKKVARPFMINPMFLILQPVELEPLAKRDPNRPDLVHRWQIIAGGEELGKCFSELNDPIDQLQRFEEQQAARDAGDSEAQFMNTEYVKALEYGLPPLSGFGMSERLVSFLFGKHIRECTTFPHIRSQDTEDSKGKRTMVAHAIILRNEAQPLWSQMNTAAHLSASFAAREGRKLIDINESNSADGVTIPMNIQHAIMMKQTSSIENLREFKNTAEKSGLTMVVFTEDMRNSPDDAKVVMAHSQKSNNNIVYLGVLVFGKKSTVEELTEGFEKMAA